MTKLFELPDGTTIDLCKIWCVSPVLENPWAAPNPGSFFDIVIFVEGSPTPTRFTLTTFDDAGVARKTAQRVAEQIRAQLVERWGANE